MHKIIRFGIAIILVLGIVLLAHQPPAEAARSSVPGISAAQGRQPAQSADKNDDCEKDKKGKDKDKCKGTVKAPPGTVLIPVTGEYSVGGFCTLRVDLQDTAITLDARLITPLPDGLPDTVQKIRQGCLLTYARANEVLFELTPEFGRTTICFAALPNQQMTVYFHNTLSPDPAWVPLETTVQAGVACAPAHASGTYVATFLKP